MVQKPSYHTVLNICYERQNNYIWLYFFFKGSSINSIHIQFCILMLCVSSDSVQAEAVLISVQEQGIEDVCIVLLKEIYTNRSITIHLHKESNTINTSRGVRQGDTISSKQFTAALESIFRTCLKRQVYMGTHHPSKEQASIPTYKDGKEYVKYHKPGEKIKHLGKRKDKGHIID